MKSIVFIVSLFGFLLFVGAISAQNIFTAKPAITVSSESVLQGEPILITIQNNLLPVSVNFDGEKIPFFIYQNRPTALIGIDLKKPPGNYHLRISFKNEQIIDKIIKVVERKKIEEPLGIPEKLGGNTTLSQNNLVSSMAKESAILNVIFTGKKAFWKEKFFSPLIQLKITDSYGYSRQTGAYNIPHKGTDFRAAEGISVMAMNRGVVRIARTYRVYGKTIVIDHGLGLQTIYMHLSKINVNEGQLVLPRQIIGKSGQTGYAEMPHLHLSVKINKISIDPMKFLEILGN